MRRAYELGINFYDTADVFRNGESDLKASVEKSFKRLDTEYIYLLQPHRIDYLTHSEETAKAFEATLSGSKAGAVHGR